MKRNPFTMFSGKVIYSYKWITVLLKTIFRNLKLFFINGLLIILPLSITVFLSKELFLIIDDIIGRYIYGKVFLGVKFSNIYGIGFAIICFLILFVGAITKIWLGQTLINFMEKTLLKTPYVKNIFSALKQLSEMIFKNNKMLFKQVVLIEYPRRGIHTIAFLSYDAADEINDKTKSELKSVFVPTTPNPTSGFLVMLPKKDIIKLDMNVEQAMKLIISGGILLPEASPENGLVKK